MRVHGSAWECAHLLVVAGVARHDCLDTLVIVGREVEVGLRRVVGGVPVLWGGWVAKGSSECGIDCSVCKDVVGVLSSYLRSRVVPTEHTGAL